MFIIETDTEERIECFVEKAELKDLGPIKKNFRFDWSKEFWFGEVEKLIASNDSIIHGLICFIRREDHLFLNLIESAKFNVGNKKKFKRVASNLIAFAGLIAIEEYEGFMAADAKSTLIDHYCKQYGFVQLGISTRIISYPSNTKDLVDLYL